MRTTVTRGMTENDTIMPSRKRLIFVACVVSAAIVTAPSIASGENTKELAPVLTCNDSAVLIKKIAQGEVVYSTTTEPKTAQLSLKDGQSFKEYLSECRSLIKDEAEKKRVQGGQCYKDRLQALIDTFESYPLNWHSNSNN